MVFWTMCFGHLLVCNVHVCLVTSLTNSLQSYQLWPVRLLCPWDSSGKNTGVGCHALLQGIFLTQGLNLHLYVTNISKLRGLKQFVANSHSLVGWLGSTVWFLLWLLTVVTVRCGQYRGHGKAWLGWRFQMAGNYVGCWMGAQLPENRCIDWAFHKKLVSEREHPKRSGSERYQLN